jgi:hypothetical protein
MNRQQLANRVLQKHGLLNVDEDADPDQLQLINAVYEEQYQLLLNDSLVSWALTDDIPAEVVTPIVQIVCTNTADIFSGTVYDLRAARMELSRIISPDYASSPTTVDYY